MNTIFRRLVIVSSFLMSATVFAQQDGHDANEEHQHDAVAAHADADHNPGEEHAEDGPAPNGHAHDEAAGDGHGHDEESSEHDDGHGHGEEASDTELSEAQQAEAGIETLIVKRRTVGERIRAPGEVIRNAYRTEIVSPRIPAQVVRRHARVGERVKKGQKLVTLSSVDMAEAQGALIEADYEYRRVKKLGRKVVSEKRFVAAQIAYRQAFAKVRAFGMTTAQVEQLLKRGDGTDATGEFTLLASLGGTIVEDQFVIGEIVEPGHVLFEITDEDLLWVEARLTPEAASKVVIGAPAKIGVRGTWLPGKVIQSRHALDETTRTLALHVEVPNENDTLHRGQFVTVLIEGRQREPAIVVPLEAVLRSADGDWQVFVETAPGRFEPQEITLVRTFGDEAIIEGIPEGTRIVSKGAFFIQSEIAKSGFAVHNH